MEDTDCGQIWSSWVGGIMEEKTASFYTCYTKIPTVGELPQCIGSRLYSTVLYSPVAELHAPRPFDKVNKELP